ncbi:hypothetical protein MHM83_10980 [Tenacibaculum sp. Mcav3-52]|uniref:hypothetical protein n=1 Tax=Flavobacteriaceae TaxID=49546 RepID=UPI001EF3B22C|nr:hypothetical protein [Tenacibaculum sp. Mcav3-52]MCG7502396.1 hypothetical protein [Tenacibaculum sp. Mcav3-52]
MNQLQQAEQFENKIKALAFEIAKQLGTTSGFMEYYFKILFKCKTQKQAFNVTNELHYLIFNHYKYNDFDSFRMSRNNYIKK